MGYYIEGPVKGKCEVLMKEDGAKPCDPVARFSDIPEGKALICCADNGPFDCAALIYSENELHAFTIPDDHRKKTWLVMDKARAHQLAGYKAPQESATASG